jgi:hypothetical protein
VHSQAPATTSIKDIRDQARATFYQLKRRQQEQLLFFR